MEYIITEFKKIKMEIGEFPNTTFLKKNGYYKLLHAIDKNGGIYSVYDALSINRARTCKPQGYWDNFKNVLIEFEKAWEQIGCFPDHISLQKSKLYSLREAIIKHGGIKRLREIYDSPVVNKVRKRKWDDYETIVKLFKELIEELGRFPTIQDLKERGKSGVIDAIISTHGGMYKLYEKLGISPKTKPNGHWKNIQNVFSVINKIIEDKGEFPSTNTLLSLGYANVVNAIGKYHGGMKKIRVIYNTPLKKVEDGYYSDFENVRAVIEEFKCKFGYFPSVSEIDKFRPGIKRSILKYHGNYLEVRMKMNEKLIKKEPGYWKDFGKVEDAIKDIMKITRIFPTQEQIDELGELGLYAGIINYHGGLTSLCKKMGFRTKSKSNLEERYKAVLDVYVKDTYYIDNRKKLLREKFGLIIVHPKTGNPLEIDRYYPNHRVAIEIQGEQHIKELAFFAKRKCKTPKEYLDEMKRVDSAKREQCEALNVKLITLDEGLTEEEILEKISPYLPLREEPIDLIEMGDHNLQDEIIRNLQFLQSEINGIVTCEKIVAFSRRLYEDILLIFGGIYYAREAAGIMQPYNSKYKQAK